MLRVATGVAFALAPFLSPEPTAAFPKCNLPDCTKLSGTHSRAETQNACDAAGGIATGTKTEHKDGYRCVSQGDQGGWVQCDSKGKCMGGDPARVAPRAARPVA